MTVSTTTNKTSYACNGSTTLFTFSFPIYASSELVVKVRNDAAGTDTTLTLTTDYTLSASPWTSGGSVTTVATHASGNTIFIYRATTQGQDTDLVANDSLPAATLETRYDKLECRIQDLEEQIARCIKVPLTDGTVTTELDDKVARASKTFGFDASGDISLT
jgi:hypothetical protein